MQLTDVGRPSPLRVASFSRQEGLELGESGEIKAERREANG